MYRCDPESEGENCRHGGRVVGERGRGLEDEMESFSCSEGSRDPPNSKRSHSGHGSMKRQEKSREQACYTSHVTNNTRYSG